MRGMHFTFTEAQKSRLERARETLLKPPPKITRPICVNVGDTIPVDQDDQSLRGHGINDLDGQLVANSCGVVERVNKLVLVRSNRSRYRSEVGDIVVGRVIEVAPKRWRVDINCHQDAILMLSAMNMPDGVQRRRTAVDELNMRCIFQENDVICAEVRGTNIDQSVQLQARSIKYGKLEKGLLLTAASYLIKRRKQHYHHLEKYGVDLILGLNGYIWVGAHVDVPNSEVQGEDTDGLDQKHQSAQNMETEEPISLEVRENICRLANSIRVLSALGFSLFLDLILDTFEVSIAENVDIKEMLAAEFFVKIAEREAERRNSGR